MAQLSDDCFAFGGSLKPAAEALALIENASVPIVNIEIVPLSMASGRILAQSLTSPFNVPPHDNAAVDGYAVYYDDLNKNNETRLTISGRATAGHPFKGDTPRGSALQVFTGAAILPDKNGNTVDTIFMQEDCRLEDDHIVFPPGIKIGSNKRHAGEDIRAGSIILKAGQKLRPQDVGLAAAAGFSTIPVYTRLQVAVFSTGDELFEPGVKLPSGGIYDSNRYTICSLLENLGCTVNDLGILCDNETSVKKAIATAASHYDIIITSGGVSTGAEDHVKAALEKLGTLHFWRLAIRPGRPIAFGQINQVPFIGLPGNPVAVMVTFLLFARPLLLRLGGCHKTEPQYYQVTSAFEYKKKHGRREWLRARIAHSSSGELIAEKFSRDGAGVLSSIVFADGLIEVEESVTLIKQGDIVKFLSFNEISR